MEKERFQPCTDEQRFDQFMDQGQRKRWTSSFLSLILKFLWAAYKLDVYTTHSCDKKAAGFMLLPNPFRWGTMLQQCVLTVHHHDPTVPGCRQVPGQDSHLGPVWKALKKIPNREDKEHVESHAFAGEAGKCWQGELSAFRHAWTSFVS